MANSGVKMGSDDILYYKEHFKLRRPGQALYLVYYIKDGLIKLDRDALKDALPDSEGYSGMDTAALRCKKAYEDILRNHCPENNCRFIVFDFVTEGADGKIFYIMWNPDTASPKLKMLYASSKGAMKKEMEGTIQLEAKDQNDISYDILAEMATKSCKK